MMWMWMSAIIVLFGAELNSGIEHQTARDTTVGHPKPLGARGRRHGRHVGTGGSSRAKTTLASRININAKVAPLGEAQQPAANRFRVSRKPTGPSDLRALRAT